jgi:hypothetical protein
MTADAGPADRRHVLSAGALTPSVRRHFAHDFPPTP